MHKLSVIRDILDSYTVKLLYIGINVSTAYNCKGVYHSMEGVHIFIGSRLINFNFPCLAFLLQVTLT